MIAKSTLWSKKTLVNEGYTIELYPNNVPPYDLFIEDAGIGNVIDDNYVIMPIYGAFISNNMVYRGAWSGGVTYIGWEVVFYNDNLWIYKNSGQNNNAPSIGDADWYLLNRTPYAQGSVDENYIKDLDFNLIYDVQIEKTYDEKTLSLGFPKVDNLKFKINYAPLYEKLYSIIYTFDADFDTLLYYNVLLNALINPTINLSSSLSETYYKGLDVAIDNPFGLTEPGDIAAWKNLHRIQNKYLANVYTVKKNDTNDPFNNYLLNISVQNNRYELDMDIFNTEKVIDIETESIVSYIFKMLSWEQLELDSQLTTPASRKVSKYVDIYKSTRTASIPNGNTATIDFIYREELNTWRRNQSTYNFYNQIWRKFYTLLYKYFFQFQFANDAAIKTAIDSLLPTAQTNTQKLTPYGYHEYYIPDCFINPNENKTTPDKGTPVSFYDLYFNLNHPTYYKAAILQIPELNYSKTCLGKWKNLYQFLNQEYNNNSCIFNYRWYNSNALVLMKEFNPILNFYGYNTEGTNNDWIIGSIYKNLLNIEDFEQPKFTYRVNITKGVNHSQTEAAQNDKELKKYEITDKTIESTFIPSLKDNFFNGNTTLNDLDINIELKNFSGDPTGSIKITNRNSLNPFLLYYHNDFPVKVFPEIAMFRYGTGGTQFAITNMDTVTGGLDNKGYTHEYIPTFIGDLEALREYLEGDIADFKEYLLTVLQDEQKNSFIKTQANFLFDNFKTIKNSTIEGTIPILTKSEYYPLYAGSYGYFVNGSNTEEIPEQIQQFLKLQNNFIVFLSSKLNLENNEATNKYLILSR